MGTVNLSNGALNINLPLGTVGGRGFSIPIPLNYSSKIWSVAKDTTSDPFNQHQYSVAFASYGDGQFGYGEQAAAGWRIGGVPAMARQFVGIAPCSDLNTSNMYAYRSDKLAVVMPDGAEV